MDDPNTPVSSSLDGLLDQLPPGSRARVILGIIEVAEKYREIAARPGADARSVARSIHNLVDSYNNNLLRTHPMGKDVSCRRGCNACCHMYIDIDPLEASLLVGAVKEGLPIDHTRLARQAGRTAETWLDLPRRDRQCVFNDDETGDCRVYEDRPRACRKYQVVTDPDLCELPAPGYPVRLVGRLAGLEAEATHAASFAAFGGDSLANLVSKGLVE